MLPQPNGAITSAQARELWTRFHQKKPRVEEQVATNWPTSWKFSGDVSVLWYLSDKWVDDGEFRCYYHPTTARCWEPGTPLKSPRLPELPTPNQAAILGFCLGWELVTPGKKGQRLWAECDEDDLLCAVELEGRTFLFVIDGDHHINALFEGDELAVKPEGIIG